MKRQSSKLNPENLGGNTGALYNKGIIHKETNLSTPPEDSVIEAKEWVDNGSRL